MALTHLPHVEGATEPHIVEIVCALVMANDAHRVLETGGFLGHTSLSLAETLGMLARTNGEHRQLIVAEIDQSRAEAIDQALYARVAENGSPAFQWRVVATDVLQVIDAEADESLDAVWIDDDHTPAHVAGEVQALLPKMRTNGLLLFHDVYGVCDLQAIVKQYGGYSLDLPRWGPAGGLGIIQVR